MRPEKATPVVIAAMLVWLASGPLRGHSIPTHKNITIAAVGWLLEAQPRLQCPADGKTALTNALLWGTEHEDDDYEAGAALKMGRYMMHFRPVLDDEFAAIEIAPLNVDGVKVSLGTVDLGVFRTEGCSSLEWGGFQRNTPGNVTCTYQATRANTISMTNVNTWGNALADAAKASRFSGFSEGFVKLGFLIHLVEDQSSPAHALNASHGHKAMPVDVLAALDPAMKGQTVDFGFPDPMEVDPAGNDARRDVPPSAWPPRNASQLLNGGPGDFLLAMHAKTTSQGYSRESMHDRTARMFKNVAGRVEAQLPKAAKDLGLPWPLGRETLAQEVSKLKRSVATIIRDEIQKEALAEMKATWAKSAGADREWAVLGPEAVRLSASLLWKYINDARPVMGTGTAACTVR